MDQNIINQLKKFKKIKPTEDFRQESRRLILATPIIKKSIFPFPTWALAGTLVGLGLIIISLISLTLPSSTKLTSAFPKPEDLKAEFNNLSINIQLQEISYYQNVNDVIALVLDEISDTAPRYLKKSLLENELKSFEINETFEKRNQINELLNKIIN